MVRLKVSALGFPSTSTYFQFHYGTIKRVSDGSGQASKFAFNSTMVRLKVSGLITLLRIMLTFNSTMVRLKESPYLKQTRSKTSFNSTMVRLKVGNYASGWNGLNTFNSTMVRLKAFGARRTNTHR